MAHSSVISSKGQVTVPQEIRIRLGLKKGDRVEFVVEGVNIIIRPVRAAENPFEAYAGVLRGAFSHGVRAINTWVDEMRRDKRSLRRERCERRVGSLLKKAIGVPS
ncbi:MAG: AbrB/MazE/SpoVT family DNA-binding domain-containing protein [Terriglobia bacterium]|jgi:AbrB family looped-hinge helix DNA binding protein